MSVDPETDLLELEAVAADLERRGAVDLGQRIRSGTRRLARALGAHRESLRQIDARLDDILQVVTSMTALDFDHKIQVEDDDDWLIKALGFGLNMMGDEFKRVTEDLTEVRDRALAASRAKSAFLANMSHELRTPLNAIIGYSELVRDECQDQLDPTHLADLERIVSAARHLLALIKDTLDLSKIEAGRMDVVRETFDIAALVDEVTATLAPLVTSRGNRLLVERDADLGVMHSDRTKLAQTLYNLLSNANKFTTLGTLRLVARAATVGEEPGFEFTVEDTGIGIPRDKLDTVFVAFNQGDDSIARRYGGTGLGLTITRHFCEMLGGEIRMQSEVGRGSTFTILLPSTLPITAHKTAPPAAVVSDHVLLVASPEPLFHEVVRLNAAGSAVVPVVAGGAVARIAGALRPAAILLDDAFGEPELRSTLLALKDEPEAAAIPVYVAVGALDRNATLSLGATEVIRKPLRREALHPLLGGRADAARLGRVLAVSDGEGRREALRRLLETRGWELRHADSAVAAAAELASARFDAVLIDGELPELGVVLRAARALPVFGLNTSTVAPQYAKLIILPPERLPAALAQHVHAARANMTTD